MALGDVVDELHDEHSLAHAGTAEEANLATTLVGSQQVHHLTVHTPPFKVISFPLSPYDNVGNPA